MRTRHLLSSVLLFFSMVACKKDVEPVEEGLSGTWLLVQNRFWDGRTTVIQNIAPAPARTVTFTSSGELSTIAINDSILTPSRYYQASYSELIGPLLSLDKTKDKAPSQTLLKYLVYKDTLQLSPVGQATFGYVFRRL